MLTRLIEWFRAWRRGDKRVAEQGVRGRVYERRKPTSPGPVAARGKAELEMVITRADGSQETVVVPATVERR